MGRTTNIPVGFFVTEFIVVGVVGVIGIMVPSAFATTATTPFPYHLDRRVVRDHSDLRSPRRR